MNLYTFSKTYATTPRYGKMCEIIKSQNPIILNTPSLLNDEKDFIFIMKIENNEKYYEIKFLIRSFNNNESCQFKILNKLDTNIKFLPIVTFKDNIISIYGTNNSLTDCTTSLELIKGDTSRVLLLAPNAFDLNYYSTNFENTIEPTFFENVNFKILKYLHPSVGTIVVIETNDFYMLKFAGNSNTNESETLQLDDSKLFPPPDIGAFRTNLTPLTPTAENPLYSVLQIDSSGLITIKAPRAQCYGQLIYPKY